MSKKNTYGVVITFFSEKGLIANCLQSLRDQTFKPKKVVFVGPNKCEITVNIIKEFINDYDVDCEIVFLSHDPGPGYARLIGANKIHEDFLMFLDGDDLWLKNKAQIQMEIMCEKNLDLCSSNYFQIINNKKYLYSFPKSINWITFALIRGLGLSTICIKSNLAKKYLETGHYKIGEDFLFVASVLINENITAYCIQEELVNYTYNEDGLTRKRLRNLIIIYGLYKKLSGMIIGTLLMMGFILLRIPIGLIRKIKAKKC